MDAKGLDLGEIVDLTTQVATSGALRLTELMMADDLFEYTIGVVIAVKSVWGN